MLPHRYSASLALQLGDAVGVDWDMVTLEEFQRALDEEDMPDDDELCARRAWAHVRHDPAFGGRSSLVA